MPQTTKTPVSAAKTKKTTKSGKTKNTTAPKAGKNKKSGPGSYTSW